MFRKTLIAAVAVAAAVGVVAPSASAGEADLSADLACTSYLVPDGVGGYNISVGGQTVRVPRVEDIRVCQGTSGVSLYSNVVQQHSFCGATCFSVWGPASVSNPTVSVSACYTEDGIRRCVSRSAGAALNVSRPCYVSVGKPAQHTPSQCLVVVDEDPSLPLP